MEEAERQGREDDKSKRKEHTTLEKVVLELEAAPALPRAAPAVPASELRAAPAAAEAPRAEGDERTRRGGASKRKRKERAASDSSFDFSSDNSESNESEMIDGTVKSCCKRNRQVSKLGDDSSGSEDNDEKSEYLCLLHSLCLRV